MTDEPQLLKVRTSVIDFCELDFLNELIYVILCHHGLTSRFDKVIEVDDSDNPLTDPERVIRCKDILNFI